MGEGGTGLAVEVAVGGMGVLTGGTGGCVAERRVGSAAAGDG